MTDRREPAARPAPNAAELDFFGAQDVAERAQHFTDIFANPPGERMLLRIFGGILVAALVLGFALVRARPEAPMAEVAASEAPARPAAAAPAAAALASAKTTAAPGSTTAAPGSLNAAPGSTHAAPGSLNAAPGSTTAAPGSTTAPAFVAAASAPSNPATDAAEPPRPSPAAVDSPWLGRKLAAFAAADAAQADPALARAREALDRRDYEGAVKLLEALPRSAAVDAALGRAWFELGRDAAAVAALRRARAAEPGHAEALLVLGTVLESRRDLDGAREAFRAYLAHHPHGEHAAEVRAVLAGL